MHLCITGLYGGCERQRDISAVCDREGAGAEATRLQVRHHNRAGVQWLHQL